MALTHRGLYVCFVLVMIQGLANSDQPCEVGWTHHDPSRTCLKHVTQAKNEQDSRTFCQTFRGCGGNMSAGHLVYIQDTEMGSFIQNMVPNSTIIRVDQTSYTLGQNLNVTPGSEPTPSGPTPRVYVMTTSGLESWHPSTKTSFICQIQHGCSSPNQDSVYRDLCFHLTTNASQEWAQANRTCMQQGRNLLSLHSLADNEFLHNLTSAYRTDSDFREGRVKNTLAIGLHRDNRDSKFVWTDTTPYNFSKWRSGEPTFFYKNLTENCTEMYINSGEWNDIPCVNVKLFGFVCKSRLCSNSIYHAPSKSCMKFVTDKRNYTQAQDYCKTSIFQATKKIKGHLVNINNIEVYKFVKENILRQYGVTGGYVEVSDLGWLEQSTVPVLKKGSSLALTRQGPTWLYPTDLAEFVCQVNAVDRKHKSPNLYAVIGVLCVLVAGLSTLTVLLCVKLRASRRGGELQLPTNNSEGHVAAQEVNETNIYMNISGVHAVTDVNVTSTDETKSSATAGYDTLHSELCMTDDGVYSMTVF